MSPGARRTRPAWLAWIGKAVSRMVRLVWRIERHRLAVLDLRGDAAAWLPGPAAGVSWREMVPADLDADGFAGFGPDRLRRARDRFPACRGVVVTRDGRPAGWAFVTTAPRPREGWPPLVYAVTPPPGLAYVFDVFVLPGHRGLGLARELVACCARLAARDGLCGLFLTYSHPAMARVVSGLGFRRIGTLMYRRVLWMGGKDLSALDRIGRWPADAGAREG